MPPWLIHCDGSAMPNPGRMGLGAVIVAPDGTRHTLSQASGERGCNNEAELRALMAALRAARSLGATAVHAHSDNSIVVAQLGEATTPPIARLAPLFDEARALLRSFDAATLTWIPRHRNGEADVLARAALGLAPKAAATRRPKR
ncbi:MAG: ribonuclease HI family protein [Variovorax sp.]|nr:MAG: ribonuclease HI family protein [Variovorax sp.]